MCEDVPVVACGYQMTCQLIAVCLKILVKPTLTHECSCMNAVAMVLFTLDTAFIQEHLL